MNLLETIMCLDESYTVALTEHEMEILTAEYQARYPNSYFDPRTHGMWVPKGRIVFLRVEDDEQLFSDVDINEMLAGVPCGPT